MKRDMNVFLPPSSWLEIVGRVIVFFVFLLFFGSIELIPLT
jgi:hypothetical protein